MSTMQNHNRKKQGLVISYFGSSVAVLVDNEKTAGKSGGGDGSVVIQCHLRRNQTLPVVGDRVTFEYEMEGDQTSGVIIAIEPRRSLLERHDGRSGKKKPIAANVDIIMIVMAPPPIFAEYLIDRYLAAAELLNIRPALVLNKIDLLEDAKGDAPALPMVEARLQPYRALQYPVFLSSIYRQDSLSTLRDFLHHKTAVLVGPSGVGKSSIIARLAGLDSIRVADVSAKGVGKHTTTATRLYPLPAGGSVIDSPGVREFNLWPVSSEELRRGFKELQAFAGKCKFRDCRHLTEPGCSVQAAVVDGKISGERLANYHLLCKKTKDQK